MKKRLLIYGANGYTGALLARYAGSAGLQPVLAGRNATAVSAIAERYQLPWLAFDLNDKQALHQALSQTAVVIHAAGPFTHTARQMVEACIATGTHYLDINGDIAVFEFIKTYDQQAKDAGVMLLPGAGFDVVPTDCVALELQQQLPDATELELAFIPVRGRISHGTATTMASKAGEGGCIRRNGRITRQPLGHSGKWLTVQDKRMFVMSIPWGDISTAFVTTGIPNIVTYTGMRPMVYQLLKFQFLYNWLLRTSPVRRALQKRIDRAPAGPTDAERDKARTYIFGHVTNQTGDSRSLWLQTADGYTVTVEACLLIAAKVLQGQYKPGYQTPAGCYGSGLVFELPATQRLT